jgi:parallel beta-helix repeat protein
MNVSRLLLTFAVFSYTAHHQSLHAGVVTNTADAGPGSLRDAVSTAINGELITFAPSLNDSTITLTSGELMISNLQLSIDASALSKPIKISGNTTSRIFNISSSSNVSLNSLEIFDGRSVGNNGGGIVAIGSNLNLTNTTIRDCASTIDGGGLWLNNVSGNIDRCSIVGNDSQVYGGGIYLIGGVSPTVKNSVISGNRGLVGGGVFSFFASPALINCTIQGNSGAGIHLEFSAAPTLRNTIVWGNRTGEGSVPSQQIRFGENSNASADVDYSLVEQVASTLNNLDGTISVNNPNFIVPVTPISSATPPTAISDLRVFTNSAVFDAGSNVSNSSLLDRAGKPRVQNTTIDIGAFEGGYVTFAYLHPSLGPNGDSNGNGLSNFLEYATGIDPTAPDDPTARPLLSRTGGFFLLTSSQRSNAADTSTVWQSSTTLTSNSWVDLMLGTNYTIESTSNITVSRQQVVMKLLDMDSRRFYRQSNTRRN